MTTIVTRIAKGTPLTFVEADANFTNLNNDKAELTALAATAGAGLIGYNSGNIYAAGTVGKAIQDGGGGGGGSAVFTEASTAPVSPTFGARWLDTDIGVLFTYIDNGGSPTWAEL